MQQLHLTFVLGYDKGVLANANSGRNEGVDVVQKEESYTYTSVFL